MELGFLDVLAAHGYAMPSAEQLARAAMTSVDEDYVREMGGLRYRLGRVEALVTLTNHGIGPAFVRALGAMGYERLAPDALVRLRSAGVDTTEVRRFNAHAGRRLTVDELRLAHERMGEVPPAPAPPAAPDAPAVPTPDSVPPRGEGGDTPLTGRWVVHATRDGWVDLELFWSDDTNWRRRYRASSLRVGAGSLALEQDAGTFEMTGALQGGRGSGALRFTPHRDFVRTLRTLGIRGTVTVTDHNLKNLAWGEISAAPLRELQEIGYRSLTLEEIQSLGIFGVTSRFARTANAGAATPMPVDELIDLGRRARP